MDLKAKGTAYSNEPNLFMSFPNKYTFLNPIAFIMGYVAIATEFKKRLFSITNSSFLSEGLKYLSTSNSFDFSE